MKLYDAAAPNPRRVRMFIHEAGIDLDVCPIDLGGEQRSAEFLTKNPLGMLPVLELEDGTCLSESFAIIDFLDRTYPGSGLLGTAAADRATVVMWDRRMEWELMRYVGDYYQHSSAFFRDRFPQIPEYGESCAEKARKTLHWLESELEERPFIAGESFSVADITALAAVDLGQPSVFSLGDELPNLSRWHRDVASRPSAQA